MRYFGSYKQAGAAGGPSMQETDNPRFIVPQGSDTIPSQIYHDLFVSRSFGTQSGRLLDGVNLQLGVRNIFDAVPPMDVNFVNNYYLSPYGDVRLRSYWLSARKSF